jgi:hypothetical protein
MRHALANPGRQTTVATLVKALESGNDNQKMSALFQLESILGDGEISIPRCLALCQFCFRISY